MTEEIRVNMKTNLYVFVGASSVAFALLFIFLLFCISHK